VKRTHADKTIILFVLIIIVAGGIATLFQLHPWAEGLIEIILPENNSPTSDTAEIYIDGAVARPGWYPVYEYSTINDVILSAGGLTEGTDTSIVKLHIPTQGETNQSQKISINRAEAWLLDALPGIGPTSAQKIIDYREANGPYVTIYELLLVPGIGQSTFDSIKDLITVE
jgi:competence protein ComEA